MLTKRDERFDILRLRTEYKAAPLRQTRQQALMLEDRERLAHTRAAHPHPRSDPVCRQQFTQCDLG